ncbi:hypothetical protein [Desulfopila sp. IMCC35008]|uniref:hypothetical protein n=1 Tax=Desulfopila sp. IMCC35008 TaxID=2653858 RepID=UPI0013D3ADBB|nr:hypothetical protein [Desulfopila sp. IMCC35008]
MKMFCSLLIVLFAACSAGAEGTEDKSLQIGDYNRTTLLQKVWPGMTIEQSLGILGEPEESMEVLDSSGAEAIRYGVFWLIPQVNGLQVECIINQRGFTTNHESANSCRFVDERFVLLSQ